MSELYLSAVFASRDHSNISKGNCFYESAVNSRCELTCVDLHFMELIDRLMSCVIATSVSLLPDVTVQLHTCKFKTDNKHTVMSL